MHKKINFTLFKKMVFLRVWCRKLSLNNIGIMDMFYIMDSGPNRLYTTFANIFSLISAGPVRPIYKKIIKKKNFQKKINCQCCSNSIFDITPPKIALYEKLEIYLLGKIFSLRVKIRNFWVLNKTCISHLFTINMSSNG